MKALPILYVLIALLVFGLAAWWQVYRFHDCKNVGHSTLYCVMSIGN